MEPITELEEIFFKLDANKRLVKAEKSRMEVELTKRSQWCSEDARVAEKKRKEEKERRERFLKEGWNFFMRKMKLVED